MHVSPAKHSSASVTDRQTDRQTDRRTDRRTDRQTTNKVTAMGVSISECGHTTVHVHIHVQNEYLYYLYTGSSSLNFDCSVYPGSSSLKFDYSVAIRHITEAGHWDGYGRHFFADGGDW